MTASPELIAFLATHEGRCQSCGFHERLQGHRDGCREGVRRRDAGMAATTEAHPGDVEIVDAAIRAACAKGEPFSANSFRHLTERLDQPAVIGARMRSWLASKRIKSVGYVASNLPGTNAHKIGQYLPTERWAA